MLDVAKQLWHTGFTSIPTQTFKVKGYGMLANAVCSNMMDFEQDDTGVREQFMDRCIKQLNRVNKTIARLLVEKEKLTEDIIGAFGHEKAGQKTYEYSTWRVEVKTPFVYSINKKVFEAISATLPPEFNPVKASTTYAVDKKLCDEYMLTAPESVKELLTQCIDIKAGKKGIVIKERV